MKARLGLSIFIKIIGTLILGFFYWGVGNDIYLRYDPVLRSNGYQISESLIGVVGFSLVMLVFVLLQIWLPEKMNGLSRLRNKTGWISYGLAVVISIAFSWLLLYSKWSEVVSGTYLRLLLMGSSLMWMAWFINVRRKEQWGWDTFLAAGVLWGAVFSGAMALQDVQSYPFSIGWSEGNRMWDYSVLFGRSLYDFPVGKPIPAYIDLGRQSLWGAIFLLPNISIVTMRLWNALLFSVPYFILAWFVFDQKGQTWYVRLLLALWGYLFLSQGPIYTPLVLAALLVVWARRRPLVFSAILAAFAGYYAQFTRFTWMFAPGMWAGITAFLEPEPHGVKTTFQRWVRAGVLAVAGVFGGAVLPILIRQIGKLLNIGIGQSGVVILDVATKGNSQPFIWSRLWPNATYPLGIMWAIVLAALPALALFIWLVFSGRWKLNVWQKLATLVYLGAFFVVGIIVSVKIGGGSNLHNLDMFLIGAFLLVGLAWECGVSEWFYRRPSSFILQVLILLTVLYPASQGMLQARPSVLPYNKVQDALDTTREQIKKAAAKGEVLLMDQRQLLTFGYIKDLPLVPDYEKKYMMDKAMAEDEKYFSRFHRDLASHRFTMILSEPLNIRQQVGDAEFGDENNAYVRWVTIPVLCYYEPVENFQEVGVQLLVPRAKPLDDPNIKCPEIK